MTTTNFQLYSSCNNRNYSKHGVSICFVVLISLLFCNGEQHTDLSKNKNELANPRTSLTTVMFYMLKGDTVKVKQITTDRFYSTIITKSETNGQRLQTIGHMWKDNFDKIKWDKLNPNQTEYYAACNVDIRIGWVFYFLLTDDGWMLDYWAKGR